MQEKGGGTSTGVRVHQIEPSAERLDQLFPDRKHETVAEERIWSMAAAQSASRDTQAMEEAEDDIQESEETECCIRLQSDG